MYPSRPSITDRAFLPYLRQAPAVVRAAPRGPGQLGAELWGRPALAVSGSSQQDCNKKLPGATYDPMDGTCNKCGSGGIYTAGPGGGCFCPPGTEWNDPNQPELGCKAPETPQEKCDKYGGFYDPADDSCNYCGPMGNYTPGPGGGCSCPPGMEWVDPNDIWQGCMHISSPPTDTSSPPTDTDSNSAGSSAGSSGPGVGTVLVVGGLAAALLYFATKK